MYSTIINFFQEGGAFMYPIAFVLVIGLAITIERWLVLTKTKLANQTAYKNVQVSLKKKDFAGIIRMAESSSAPILKIIAAGVAKISQSKRRDDIRVRDGRSGYGGPWPV